VRRPAFGEHLFNRAFGFTDEQLGDALEVVSWYEEGGVPGAFEVAPGPPTGELLALLHAHGFRHTGFHAMFAGRPPGSLAAPPGVEVRPVQDAADLEGFSDAYHQGWGHTGMRVPLEPWLRAPGWSLFLGLCDGRPAGAGLLCLANGDAYLADAAVDPGYRRRGLHQALLDRRCAEAAAAGADVVFSGADFLSASHRNMVRRGLSLLFTKAIWTLEAS
jgi:ribosomal protein S18 acetylase RimI-like enzyme